MGPEKAALFLERRIDPALLTEFSFASRKEPEFMSHRLLHCCACDMVYADEIPGRSELAQAYGAAGYDSAAEAEDAASTYIEALRPTISMLRRRESALEIGTGTGALLERLSTAGFSRVIGVEPSAAAVRAAPDHRRGWIRVAMFDAAEFTPESFDLVCCFMTLEHVRDPGSIARSAATLLRPGGAFVAVTHDYRSLVNRILGRRSPIIDIEHLQLFSARSLEQLLQGTGFSRVSVRPLINRYALTYWTRLTPAPKQMKSLLVRTTRAIGGDRLKIALNVGNVLAAGFKPPS